MKRILAILAAFLFLMGLPAIGQAHAMGLVAVVSLDNNEVTVRIIDPYDNPVNRLEVRAGVALPRQKAGAMVQLPQAADGTYRGKLTPPQGDTYEILVEAIVLDEEVIRAVVPAKVGEPVKEQRAYFISDDELPGAQGGLPLEMIGFLVALIVVATVTAFAVLRKPPPQ